MDTEKNEKFKQACAHSQQDDTGAIVSSQNLIDTHVQGGRGLEGVLPAAEGGERQDPQ